MAEKTPTRPDNEHHDSPTTTQRTPHGAKLAARTTQPSPAAQLRRTLISDQQTGGYRTGESAETTGDEISSNPDEIVEDEEQLGEEEQVADEEPVEEKPARRWHAGKRVMEYELKEMYPEVNILIEQNRRKWNFRDPDVIRALWVESKTNALAEWKVRHATVAKRKRPTMEVQYNNTVELRRKFLQDKRERLKKSGDMLPRFHRTEVPEFREVKLATNLATQIRYDYNRNNPPVPYYILAHYHQYKRPPFTTVGLARKGCKPL